MTDDLIEKGVQVIIAIVLVWVFITSIVPALAQSNPESSWLLVIGSIILIIVIGKEILK